MPQKIKEHFWHFSHFIHPGAKRMAFSRYTDKIDMTAFVNPDGTPVFVMLNRSEVELPVEIRLDGQTVSFVLGAHEILTGEILGRE